LRKVDSSAETISRLSEEVVKTSQILSRQADTDRQLLQTSEKTAELVTSIQSQLKSRDTTRLDSIDQAIRSVLQSTEVSKEAVAQRRTESAALQEQLKHVQTAVDKIPSTLEQLQKEISRLKEDVHKLSENDQKRASSKPQDYAEILNKILANQQVLLAQVNSSFVDTALASTRVFWGHFKGGSIHLWNQFTQWVSEVAVSGKALAEVYGNQGFKNVNELVPKIRRISEEVIDLVKAKQGELKSALEKHAPPVAQPHCSVIAWSIFGILGLFVSLVLLSLLKSLCCCLCCCRRKKNRKAANQAPAAQVEKSAAAKKNKK